MLTQEQRTTLINYITSDPIFSGIPQSADGAYQVRDLLSVENNPAFWVWKTRVTQDEIMQNGFDWVQADNLTIGQSRIWEWLFDNDQTAINPSKTNVRDGISECWKGNAGKIAVRDVVFGHCKRKANRLERLLATGTGTEAIPATMTIEGTLSPQYLREILGW
jgi:hypothetical protein